MNPTLKTMSHLRSYFQENASFPNRAAKSFIRRDAINIVRIMIAFSLVGTAMTVDAASNWRGKSKQAVLRNDAIEATFQAGILCQLKDTKTGEILLSVDVDTLPGEIPLFGPNDQMNLDKGTVSQEEAGDSLVVTWKGTPGVEWTLHWSIEPGDGDLILNTSAESPEPVSYLYIVLHGFDIINYDAVWVGAYGVGHVISGPWNGTKMGNPERDSPNSAAFPLVALFQGKNAGWFLEGRDPVAGPANCMLAGHGDRLTVGMTRSFPLTTKSPKMYEMRLRTYNEHWENAVDPLVTWMEEEAGYVPLEKMKPEWIKDIQTQAYIGIGDFSDLEELAKQVDPQKTYVGRQAEYRLFGFDEKYPDYRVAEAAKPWIARARELGFHVGAHFNSKSIAAAFPELLEQFKDGLQETGVDLDGNVTYEHIYEGPSALVRVSASLKPWRDYFIEQLRDAVEAGIDVIYLDESMAANGKYLVDGVDGLEGMRLLMKEILEMYPHVAVQTEQFNFMTAKYGAFALSQMPLGHPLSGYIFHRFVKVVPEGVMYSPTSNSMMDAFESWGFMLPGVSPARGASWVEIAEAFQRYDLTPDARLPRFRFTKYESHYSSGEMPIMEGPIPPSGIKLFGYRGKGGVTAYFERMPDRRGLVVYEPGKEPKWFGTRYTGIRSYAGAGLPVFFSFRYTMRDWLIYNETEVLGLDPDQTYYFDVSRERLPDRFHVTSIPDDFVGIEDPTRRIPAQEVGDNDSFFKLVFQGNGLLTMHVPEEYDAYLDGKAVPVNRASKSAEIDCRSSGSSDGNESEGGYVIGDSVTKGLVAPEGSVLLAVKRIDTELVGAWRTLPWVATPDIGKWLRGEGEKGFAISVGGLGRIQGKIPNAKRIRLKGSFGMLNGLPGMAGDGVVRINDREVLRVDAGERPYENHEFDVDITEFAGQYVLLEFFSDGWTGRNSSAEWHNPRIEVE
jgi:hypothetical protein